MNFVLLGKKIKEERIKRGLTQEQLAEKCNITAQYIGIIERADKKVSLETLVKIAGALEVSLDFLVFDATQVAANLSLSDKINVLPPTFSSNEKEMLNEILDTIISRLIKEKQNR